VHKRGQVEQELELAQENEAVQNEQLGTLTAQAQELTEQAKAAGEAMRTFQSDVERYRSAHAEIEQGLHALEVSLGQSKVRLETLITRTQDEVQINIVERYEELIRGTSETPASEVNDDSVLESAIANDDEATPRGETPVSQEELEPQISGAMPSLYGEAAAQPEADAAAAKKPAGKPVPAFLDENVDWDEIAAEIKELKEKIQRLGNVNLDAIGEQDELEERSTFFSKQITDLTDSKRQLEELIDQINVESGLRFEQTLTAVREHFQGMFRKLFGGGKADIMLETEIELKPVMGPDGQMLPPEKKQVDPLEAGIEILAHPPGKKPATINQLSGGEKAMTCIALLMSIFKSKPSPFCILDEVDAPLDEANNQRFGLIIQEFLSISQFIVITHHKRTMQICDVLYGVTMQEQGVSKRVAVKFDQVDSQGRISETAAA